MHCIILCSRIIQQPLYKALFFHCFFCLQRPDHTYLQTMIIDNSLKKLHKTAVGIKSHLGCKIKFKGERRVQSFALYATNFLFVLCILKSSKHSEEAEDDIFETGLSWLRRSLSKIKQLKSLKIAQKSNIQRVHINPVLNIL